LLLFDVFQKEFDKKFGLNLNENFRAKLKMLDAIEKCRKRLTANKEAEIIIESLMDD
jgi:heat shock protein 4